MDGKFTSFGAEKICSMDNFSKESNMDADLLQKPLKKTKKLQSKYDAISLLYAIEIDASAKLLNKAKNIQIFCREKFSKIFENFRKKTETLSIKVSIYESKTLDEIVAYVLNFPSTIILIDVLKDESDLEFFSNFLEFQRIPAINISDCNILLTNKACINVAMKKDLLKSLIDIEKFQIFLDCVYLSLKTRQVIDFKLNKCEKIKS